MKNKILSFLLVAAYSTFSLSTVSYAEEKKTLNTVKLSHGCVLHILSNEVGLDCESELSCEWGSIPCLKDYYVNVIYRGDLDKDGTSEVIVQGYSGGAHCCFTYAIYSLKNPIIATYLHLGNASIDPKEIKDRDGDSISEIVFVDDHYAYFNGLSFAASPMITVAVRYDGGHLRLLKHLIGPLNKDIAGASLKPTKIEIDVSADHKNIYFQDEVKAATIISRFLLDLYQGKNGQDIGVIDKYFIGPSSAKRLLYKHLIDRAKNSIFWEDIKQMNNL